MRDLERQLKQKTAQLAARRDIGRAIVAKAKRWLMQREGLTEHGAFPKIQHRARHERQTMRQVAEETLARQG